jgi:acetyltransferase-like isoleucine patch superfamily enzyme
VKARRAVAALRALRFEGVSTRRSVHRPIWTEAPPPPSAFETFGDGAWLVPPLHIDAPERISVGAGTVILEHLEVAVAEGAHLSIGPGVRFGRFVTITCARSITIGASASSSDGVSISDTWGPLPGTSRGLPAPPPEPVVVGDGAYLGANSTVCAGVTVGRGAFVGEGAVVVDDVPSFSVVYGNPAVVVRRHDGGTGWTGPRFG